MIERKHCIMCGGSIQDIYTFKEFPIYMGTTSQSQHEDIYCNMIFTACGQCGCVQLKNLIPLEILYAEAHNDATGETWSRHHTEFCDFIKKYAKGNIVEIGGANLKVAKRLAEEKAVNMEHVSLQRLF